MTSNIGVRDLKDFGSGIGFVTSAKAKNEDDQAGIGDRKQVKHAWNWVRGAGYGGGN